VYDDSPASPLFFEDERAIGPICPPEDCCSRDGSCPINRRIPAGIGRDGDGSSAGDLPEAWTPIGRLESTADALDRELRFEMRGTRAYANLMLDAEAIVRMVRNLRHADSRRTAHDDLLNEARKIVAPLKRIHQMLSADRHADLSLVAVQDLGDALLTYARKLRAADEREISGPRREPRKPRTPSSRGNRSPSISEDMKGIAILPESEQEAALRQRICPVTGEPLGSMGKPIKVTVAGRSLFVCCQGCVNAI